MSPPAKDLFAGIVPLMEIILLTSAGFAAARQRNLPVAEAAAYSLMGSLMVLSALLQVSWLLTPPIVGASIEALTMILAVSVIAAFRTELPRLARSAAAQAAIHPRFCLAVVLSVGYLGVRAFFSPPMAMDQIPLAKLARIGQTLAGSPAGLPLLTEALPPINSAILPWSVLRFGSQSGIGIFGFSAYIVLGTATYALARRYAWPPTALTAALMVLSMPRFVCHASSCGFELIPAASSLVAVLAMYRSVETPNAGDLIMMLCAICFAMTDGPYCLVFLSVLAALAIFVLCRRHGWQYWKHSLLRNAGGGLAALPVLFLFSQTWIFAANLAADKVWVGTLGSPGLAPNPHGIQGAAVSAARYLIQMAHLPPPADPLWRMVTGASPVREMGVLYQQWIAPILEKGIDIAPFAMDWGLSPQTCWFGPFALVLLLPALGHALVRAPRRLKALAVAMTGYLYMIALMGAWDKLNVRYFSPFFACTGFVIAFFLPPWRLTRQGKELLQVLCAVLWFCAVFGR